MPYLFVSPQKYWLEIITFSRFDGKDNTLDKLKKDIENISTIQAVDLGLPSGTKWANMNIGASRPEEYGNLLAWGETETKADFSTFSWQ